MGKVDDEDDPKFYPDVLRFTQRVELYFQEKKKSYRDNGLLVWVKMYVFENDDIGNNFLLQNRVTFYFHTNFKPIWAIHLSNV